MIHFWQRSRESIENTCTFAYNTCLTCRRFWHSEEQAAARPICIMPSYDVAEAVKHYNEGNPYYYELPEWDPLGCSHYMTK